MYDREPLRDVATFSAQLIAALKERQRKQDAKIKRLTAKLAEPLMLAADTVASVFHR